MKAWLLDSLDGVKGLRLGEVETPKPGPGEVLVRLHFAALNPADRLLAERQYPAKPALPHILGRDGCGEVVAVGEGTPNTTGQMVVILRGEAGVTTHGTLAEYVVVPAGRIAPLPKEWDAAQGAAAPLVYLTAWQALSCWGSLVPGTWVIVTGASGGVGIAVLHLARIFGFRTIALTRGLVKEEALRHEGADHVLDATGDWPSQVRELVGPGGVGLAVDNIGGPRFDDLIGVMGDRGAISCVGRLAGPVPEFNTARLFFRRIRIGGVFVGAMNDAEAHEAWIRVTTLLKAAFKAPVVDRIVDFAQVPKAFDRLEEGPIGKVVIRVSPETS